MKSLSLCGIETMVFVLYHKRNSAENISKTHIHHYGLVGIVGTLMAHGPKKQITWGMLLLGTGIRYSIPSQSPSWSAMGPVSVTSMNQCCWNSPLGSTNQCTGSPAPVPQYRLPNRDRLTYRGTWTDQYQKLYALPPQSGCRRRRGTRRTGSLLGDALSKIIEGNKEIHCHSIS